MILYIYLTHVKARNCISFRDCWKCLNKTLIAEKGEFPKHKWHWTFIQQMKFNRWKVFPTSYEIPQRPYKSDERHLFSEKSSSKDRTPFQRFKLLSSHRLSTSCKLFVLDYDISINPQWIKCYDDNYAHGKCCDYRFSILFAMECNAQWMLWFFESPANHQMCASIDFECSTIKRDML